MELLNRGDISWHSDQPDVPQKSAMQMKAFLDAPIEVLLEKLNEIIGGEDEQSLTRLSAALTELKTAISQKAEKTEVDAALANVETLLREELASKANASEVNDGLMYLENRLQEESLLPLTASVDELRLAQEDHAREIDELSESKQDTLTAGEGISIVNNVISAQVNAEFTAVQDGATGDLPMGLIRFEDPVDESRTEFSLYLLEDNGSGGVEPGTGLSVPTGSVGVKSKAGQGYLLVVFCNRADGGGYLIHNGGLADNLTEMTFDQYVKTTDYASKDGQLGLMKAANVYGTGIYSGTGQLGVCCASTAEIENKSTSAYKPIAVKDVDLAVKTALTTNALAWSEEEKAAARALLGIE